MGQRSRRGVAAVMLLGLLFSLVPSAALAAPSAAGGIVTRRQPARASGIRPLMLSTPATTYTPDAWDMADDDTPAGAQDLTSRVKGEAAPNGFGKPTFDQAHAFAEATNETAPGAGDYRADVDWFKFSVSATETVYGKPYVIEAETRDAYVEPVIEVYYSANGAAPDCTPANELGVLGGDSIIDPKTVPVRDNEDWMAGGRSAALSFVPKAAGTYFVRIRPRFSAPVDTAEPPNALPAGYNNDSGAGPYILKFKAGTLSRLAGSDRIGTAIAMSKARYGDGELRLFDPTGAGGTVIVANGYNYPDALAGSTLAGVVSGPLLLTKPLVLDDRVAAEIRRLGAKRVFLLGSSAAVSDAVKTSLEGVVGVGNVTRIEGPAGSGRVQTAIAIADRAAAERDAGSARIAPVAFLANGYNFPDALAASPMAARNCAPLLLTKPDVLDPDVLAAIDRLGIRDVVILGGSDNVAPSIETYLKSRLGTSHVMRIAGANRYETAKKIAVWATGSRGTTDVAGTSGSPDALRALDATEIGLATGQNYPDALGGGAFCGVAGKPLLLNPPGANITPYVLDIQASLPAGSGYFQFGGAGSITNAGRSYIFGSAGKYTISDEVWLSLDSLMCAQPSE